jgi:hypothetical protein
MLAIQEARPGTDGASSTLAPVNAAMARREAPRIRKWMRAHKEWLRPLARRPPRFWIERGNKEIPTRKK